MHRRRHGHRDVCGAVDLRGLLASVLAVCAAGVASATPPGSERLFRDPAVFATYCPLAPSDLAPAFVVTAQWVVVTPFAAPGIVGCVYAGQAGAFRATYLLQTDAMTAQSVVNSLRPPNEDPKGSAYRREDDGAHSYIYEGRPPVVHLLFQSGAYAIEYEAQTGADPDLTRLSLLRLPRRALPGVPPSATPIQHTGEILR